MAPIILKPENALQRAEELIQVNQPQAALESLHVLLTARKHRTAGVNYESIMLKYISLVVDLKKSKMAREALSNYRNFCQNDNISSIEIVLKKFIELSEARVIEAKTKVDTNATQMDDLDSFESPLTLMYKAAGIADEKSVNERDVVLPSLRFLWDVYRTSLDILRFSPRLEKLYKFVVQQAFDFCIRYHRKNEFRRLSELLRLHLVTFGKSTEEKKESVAAESLQMLLDTRFSQLQTAIALELWNEAFRSVEDLHGLIMMSKSVKNAQLVTYYECLVKILKVSNNRLYYAAAWNQLLQFSQKITIESDQAVILSTSALLAAMSIINPMEELMDISDDVFDSYENVSIKRNRWNSFLGMKQPSRESLLKEASSKLLWEHTVPSVKDLFELMQFETVDSHVLEKSVPLLKALESNEYYVSFVPALKEALVCLFLNHCAQLGSVSFQELQHSILSLMNFQHFHEIEMLLLKLSLTEELSDFIMLIDHELKSVSFTSSIRNPIMKSLFEFSKLINYENPRYLFGSLVESMQSGLIAFQAKIVEETAKCKERRISRHAHEMAEIDGSLGPDDQIATIQLQQTLEAEHHKRLEELDRREKERMQKERQEIEKDEMRKLIEETKKKLATVGKSFDLEDPMSLTRQDILRFKALKIEEARQESEKKLTSIGKRLDHRERAFRMEEREALLEDYKRQKERDQIQYEKIKTQRLEQAKLKAESRRTFIAEVKPMLKDAKIYLDMWKESNRSLYLKYAEDQKNLLEIAKKERQTKILDDRFALALKKEKQAEDVGRLKHLEEMAEKQRRKEAEIEMQLEAKKKRSALPPQTTDSKELKKLNSMTEKQKQSELDIEHSLETKKAHAEKPRKYVPPSLRQ